MNAAEITAICTGIPAIIGAITALIVAIRANTKANNVHALTKRAMVDAHSALDHAKMALDKSDENTADLTDHLGKLSH